MAEDSFIGLPMLVTMRNPPARLKGTVSEVQAGHGLTLTNGLFIPFPFLLSFEARLANVNLFSQFGMSTTTGGSRESPFSPRTLSTLSTCAKNLLPNPPCPLRCPLLTSSHLLTPSPMPFRRSLRLLLNRRRRLSQQPLWIPPFYLLGSALALCLVMRRIPPVTNLTRVRRETRLRLLCRRIMLYPSPPGLPPRLSL